MTDTPVSTELKEQLSAFLRAAHEERGKPAPDFTIDDTPREGTIIISWMDRGHFAPDELPNTFTAPDGTIHPFDFVRGYRFGGPWTFEVTKPETTPQQ